MAAWKARRVAQPLVGGATKRRFQAHGSVRGRRPRQRALARRDLPPSLHVHLEDAVRREQRVAVAPPLPPLATSLVQPEDSVRGDCIAAAAGAVGGGGRRCTCGVREAAELRGLWRCDGRRLDL